MLAIYIPVYLDKWNLYANWLTPERLHTIIGTAVYVASLLAVYPLADLASKSKACMSPEMPGYFLSSKLLIKKFPNKLLIKMVYRLVPPMLCYFSITLVIPFLHNAGQNDFKKFVDYATLITSVCFVVIFVSCIIYSIRELLRGKKYLESIK
jgi:hypothetical protein